MNNKLLTMQDIMNEIHETEYSFTIYVTGTSTYRISSGTLPPNGDYTANLSIVMTGEEKAISKIDISLNINRIYIKSFSHIEGYYLYINGIEVQEGKWI